MSMDEISRTIGGMEAVLKIVASDVKDIKEGKMALCREHGEDIARLKGKQPRNNDGSRNYIELAKGHLKASGWPAAVIAVVVSAIIYLKYFQPDQIKMVAKEAAAVVVAEARAEMRGDRR